MVLHNLMVIKVGFFVLSHWFGISNNNDNGCVDAKRKDAGLSVQVYSPHLKQKDGAAFLYY